MHILVVDDDFGSRAGMVQSLQLAYPAAELHQARSLAEAFERLAAQPAMDLVLLDLNVEDSRGLATLRQLKAWCEERDCNPRIVVVSAASDYDDTILPDAIELCATGFIAKGTSEEVFRSAVDLTLAGSIFIPERYMTSRRRAPTGAATEADEVQLTAREGEVATQLLKGMSYKQIARRLSGPGRPMSEHTVRVHVQRIAWKLRVADEAQAEGLPAKAAVLTAFADGRLRAPPRED
jgi:DNA-binding NarL/FixJ family response regulator